MYEIEAIEGKKCIHGKDLLWVEICGKTDFVNNLPFLNFLR